MLLMRSLSKPRVGFAIVSGVVDRLECSSKGQEYNEIQEHLIIDDSNEELSLISCEESSETSLSACYLPFLIKKFHKRQLIYVTKIVLQYKRDTLTQTKIFT